MCDKLGDFEKIPTCFSAQNDSIKIFASIFWSVSAENLIISTGKKCFDHFWPNNFFGSWATQGATEEGIGAAQGDVGATMGYLGGVYGPLKGV